MRAYGDIRVKDRDGNIFEGEVELVQNGKFVRVEIGGKTARVYSGVTPGTAFEWFFDSVTYLDGGVAL